MKSFKNYADIIFAPLLFLMPFIYFLAFNNYSYAQPEILAIAFGLILLGLICTALWHLSGYALQTIFISCLVTLVVSFLPGFHSAEILLLTFFITLLIAMCFHHHLTELLTIITLTFLIGVFYLPMTRQLSRIVKEQHQIAPINTKLPPIIHLILDEHISVEGTIQTKTAAYLKKTLQTFYQKNNFQLFGNAYSHYLHTYNAIPNLLNFTTEAQDGFYFPQNDTTRVLTKNLYFEKLQKLGYQFRIYQADFIDYCRTNNIAIAACYTYPAASVKNIETAALPVREKILFVLKSFLISSTLYDGLITHYQYQLRPFFSQLGWQLPEWQWYQARTCNLPMMTVFDQLIKDVKQHPQGTVFFAHMLLPHNPYIYTANCDLNPHASRWQIDVGPLPQANTLITRAKRYALYGQQLQCGLKQLERLFTALRDAGVYDQAIIIIHGDHGSRIMLSAPSMENKVKLDKQAFADTYATLFAIKIPGIKPTYHLQPQPLETLLAQALMPLEHFPLTKKQDFIYLVPTVAGEKMEKTAVPNI